jgi:diacylglycerol kinase family enzyme
MYWVGFMARYNAEAHSTDQVTWARRICAVGALLASAAAIAVVVVAFAQDWPLLLASLACVTLGIGAAAYGITRNGARRNISFLVAVLALVAPLVLIAVYGRILELVLFVVLILAAQAASQYALAHDRASLRSGAVRGAVVGPATKPVLIMNPKSGGGKVERFQLIDEARRRGIEPIVLQPADDLAQLAQDAVDRGADVIGMAGGDGSQALVAGIAMRNGLAYVCVPAGTRNHLAMDLGLDRDDVVGALEAFGEANERRIDLGLVGDRVFVNNATLGLYAKIVQSPSYRARKMGTALDMLPSMIGPDAVQFDLRFTGPDGVEHKSAQLILVSNDRYELEGSEGFGSRRSIDGGVLGIVTATFDSASDLARFVRMEATNRGRRFPGWSEWTSNEFEVRSDGPIEIGIDGEALLLDSPIRFRITAGALRVRIPKHAPGYSPAAARPVKGWSAITALMQTAIGRPVAT